MSVSDTCVNIEKYDELKEELYFKRLGKIAGVVGLTIESVGPDAKLNDLCRIYSADNSQELYAEVVGFNDSNVLLMPYDVVDGIGPGSCLLYTSPSPRGVEETRMPSSA